MSNKKVNIFDLGYIKKRKAKLLSMTLIMIGMGLLIFLIGLLLNKWQARNIFSILAVLFALPMARYLTVFAVVMPYKSADKKKYDEINSKLTNGAVLCSDLVFTSTETPMHLDFLVLSGASAYGYCEEPKKDKEKKRLSKVEPYLDNHFKEAGFNVKTKVFTDFNAFLDAAGRKENTAEDTEVLIKEKESMEYFIV